MAALLASLSMLGPFSIDMYLPALPAIGQTLGAGPLALQQTLSVYLIAYAFMMLWHGAIADAFGRRPVVLAGLAVYGIGTLGCAIAGNIESLWLFRGVQGLSAGAGLVVGRAIIRDRFHGAEAQRLMSQITMVFGIAPALAPLVGGALLNLLGWRAIFWVLFVMVVGMLAWAARRLPETLPRSARQTVSAATLWHNYTAVLTRVDFLLLGSVPTLNFCGFFLYIAVAPAFLIDLLGITTWGFAWLFLPMITGVLIGATISGRLAGRRSPARTIRLGYTFMFAGAILNVAVSSVLAPWPLWNVMPIMVFTIGSSIIMPSITLLLLDLFPTMRGLASSLQGFLQFATGALVAAVVAPLLAGSLAALSIGMAAFALGGYVTWLVYQGRRRPRFPELPS